LALNLNKLIIFKQVDLLNQQGKEKKYRLESFLMAGEGPFFVWVNGDTDNGYA
jgi:hypothetical protein